MNRARKPDGVIRHTVKGSASPAMGSRGTGPVNIRNTNTGKSKVIGSQAIKGAAVGGRKY